MIVYNTITKLARRTVAELEGMLMSQLETSEVNSKLINIGLNVTPPGSINHNTWQKLQNRFRTYDNIDGLLIDVLEVSIRNKKLKKDITIVKPSKEYNAVLKLIKSYDVKIKH